MNKDYQKELEKILENLPKRKKKPKLLLHVCCAPCSSYVLEYLTNYFDITLYFYNPNIEPLEEFDKRVTELKRLVTVMPLKNNVDIIVETYDNSEFKEAVRGYENLGERSERCSRCYFLRMNKAAEYAKNNKFHYFTTTLSISPYKNSEKLNEIGENLEKKYKIKYLYADFKKKNGYKRSIELSKIYNLYRQDYCGCIFSKAEAEIRKKRKEIKENVSSIVIVDNKDIKTKKSDYSSFSLAKLIFISIFLAIVSIIAIKSDLGNNNIDIIDNTNMVDIDKSLISIVNSYAMLEEYYFYGKHFNIKGNIEVDTHELLDANLVFIGKNYQYSYDIKYDYNDNGINFYVSNVLNNGLNIEKVNIDKYEIFIEVKKGEKSLYYPLKNLTDYDNTIYYSITENEFNKKFQFNTIDDILYLDVLKSEDEIYDVVLDPGHGGEDEGACYNGLCETDFTLELSNLLKNELENKGYKVKLTRDIDVDLKKYGEDSRVDRSYNTKAKLLISIHLNSTVNSYNGFEIYTSNHIDYTLARNFVNALDSVKKLNISNNLGFRVEPGIYTRTFDNYNLNQINSEVAIPYTNISTDTNYYFMIRETGGYKTGAYIDGQDGNGENIHRNSNVGIESYILELGYINNTSDVEIVKENKEEYMKEFSNVIDKYLSE